jgi:predicted Zn finger-like uncharacterized protein
VSLAARCPACGTVFRVVQDQLRVSEGWVRCGRCAEVFNAIDNLVDLEAGLPAPAPAVMRRGTAGTEVPAGTAHAGRRAAPAAPPAPPAPSEPPVAPPAPAPAAEPRQEMAQEIAREPAQEGASEQSPEQPAEQPPAAAAPAFEATPAPSAAAETAATASAGAPMAAAAPQADASATPAFVRRAERAALWRRPAMRAGLAGLALAAALALLLQIVVTYRDGVAARWPALRPALEALCASAGCRIEAPRAIESLAVESSGLVRIDGSATYRLSVVLANRSPLALALPALDLTLTDARGDVIARRALTAAEMGITATSLPGRSEQAVQATLQVGDRPVAGYTIEIFYP